MSNKSDAMDNFQNAIKSTIKKDEENKKAEEKESKKQEQQEDFERKKQQNQTKQPKQGWSKQIRFIKQTQRWRRTKDR